MNRRISILLVTVLCGLLLLAPAARAASEARPPSNANAPGATLASTLSTITGVAISPLLGMGGVGAWKYFHTPSEKRTALPWYAQIWFWCPALVLALLVFLKDALGTAAPTALKKPLDVAETVEHKICGLIAIGAFVPIFAYLSGSGAGDSASSLSGSGMAAIELNWLYGLLMVPIGMIICAIVFMASNAINILILLSPFTTVDTALKAFRGLLLSSVVITSLINSTVGLVWAAIIILVAWFVAGWSYRLSTLGMIYLWDLFTFRRKRFTPDPRTNSVFLGRRLEKVPVRTYGRIERDGQNRLVFRYKPLLVLPEKQLLLPEGTYSVGRGLFASDVVLVKDQGMQEILLLPPRYRSHEEQLAKIYGMNGVVPVGLCAVWNWIKEMMGFGTCRKIQEQPA
jgi:hypothetical protein